MNLLARFQLVSPPATGQSAIALIHVVGDAESVLQGLGAAPLAAGEVGLRNLGGIDRGVVARWDPSTLLLMPHASPLIVAELLERLAALGCTPLDGTEPLVLYPEASSDIEARMLYALSHAASPLAIDLLVDQPRRWAAAPSETHAEPDVRARSRLLDRLVTPPTVVAIGRPNIGKSTLLNTLAGRAAAAVADIPGTTRDHVGVTLDLAGLVVRWIDTPGLDAAAVAGDSIQAEAQSLARSVAAAADLVVLCADSTGPPPTPPPGVAVLTVGLRSDLGPPDVPVQACVSTARGNGLAEFVAAVREALVPAPALADPGPWKFWA
ncbi:MAG: GTPase [Phycisphaerales bacterium]